MNCVSRTCTCTRYCSTLDSGLCTLHSALWALAYLIASTVVCSTRRYKLMHSGLRHCEIWSWQQAHKQHSTAFSGSLAQILILGCACLDHSWCSTFHDSSQVSTTARERFHACCSQTSVPCPSSFPLSNIYLHEGLSSSLYNLVFVTVAAMKWYSAFSADKWQRIFCWMEHMPCLEGMLALQLSSLLVHAFNWLHSLSAHAFLAQIACM